MNEHNLDYAELGRLIALLCDGTLGAEEHAQLEALLLNNPSAQEFYHDYLAVDSELSWNGVAGTRTPGVSDEWNDERVAEIPGFDFPPPPSARRRWLVLGVAGISVAAVIAVLVGFTGHFQKPGDDSPTPPPTYARLVELVGDAEVLTPSGEVGQAQVGQTLEPGQTVRVAPDDSFAVVEYADGTRLEMLADTVARLTIRPPSKNDGGGKQVFVSRGLVRSDVARQPAGQPMLLATPHAEIRILGTRFVSAVARDGTRVEMEQGRVEVIRQADGRTVEVEQGKYVRATADPTLEPLVTRPLPELLSQPWNVLNTTTRSLAFSSTGEQLAFLWRERLSVWNATDWRIDHALSVPDREIRDVEFIPGRPELALTGRTFTFKVLGLADGKQLHAYTSPNRVILPSVCVSPQTGDVFWLEQEKGKSFTLKRWTPPQANGEARSLVEPETIGTTSLRDVFCLAVSMDGKMVIAGTKQGKLVFWDVGNQVEGIVFAGPPRRITGLTFSPDGRWLAAAQEGEVRIWEVATRTIHRRLEGQGRAIVSLTFSPDGSILATGRNDGTAKLWNHLNGEELATIAHSKRGAVRCLAFAPHGRLLVTAIPGKPVLVWNLTKGEEVGR